MGSGAGGGDVRPDADVCLTASCRSHIVWASLPPVSTSFGSPTNTTCVSFLPSQTYVVRGRSSRFAQLLAGRHGKVPRPPPIRPVPLCLCDGVVCKLGRPAVLRPRVRSAPPGPAAMVEPRRRKRGLSRARGRWCRLHLRAFHSILLFYCLILKFGFKYRACGCTTQ